MNYEKDLPIDQNGSWTGYFRGVDKDGISVLVPREVFYEGGVGDQYLGTSTFATNPGTPDRGFWICGEQNEGVYVNFGNQTAKNLDRFYWNKTNQNWDRVPYISEVDNIQQMIDDTIDPIDKRVTTNEDNITDHETRLSETETKAATNETNVGTNTNNISNNGTQISAHDNELANHEARITANEANIAANQSDISGLQQNQITGVEVYSTYADLPATGTVNVSYKVSNDPTSTNNGYYHWDGSAYVKDADIMLDNAILANDLDANGKKVKNLAKGTFPTDAANMEQIRNVDAVKIKNLFDKSKATDGYYIQSNGTITANSGYGYSDYILVEEGKDYSVSSSNYHARFTCYYDSNKNVVTGGSDTDITTFTIPTGVRYVRFSYYISYKDSYQFEQASAPTTFQEFGYHLEPQVLPDGTIKPLELQDISGTGLSRDANGLLNVGVDDNTIEESANKLQVKDNSLKNEKINYYAGIDGEKTGFLKKKNLFYKPGGTDGYFIDHNIGTLIASSLYGTTDFMRIQEGVDYTGFDGTLGIRKACYFDKDKNAIGGNIGISVDTTTFTVPTGHNIEYIRVSYYLSGKDTFQFEQASAPTAYEESVLKFETTGKQKVEVIPTKSTVKTIDIANSDKIIFFGDSYTEQFQTVKGKSYLAYLSMFSDWNFENYSRSGNDYPAILARIKSDDPTYKTGYGISKYNGNYAFLISYTNDNIVSQSAFQKYISDLEEVIRAVKGLGMTPVICTEYHNSGTYGNLLETSLSKVANEYGCLFVDLLPKTNNFFNVRYPNFWYTSHPGIRANTLFWDNLKPFIETLPRPRQGVKIFRKRDTFTISAISDLLYKDNLERAKRFRELIVSQFALLDTDEKYFDDLTTLNGLTPSSQKAMEYLDLRNGDAVSFPDYALVEIITPTIAKYIDTFKLVLSDATLTVHAKDNVNNVWTQLTNDNGVCELPQFMNYFDADKISFLLYKSGGFTLTDCYAEWSGIENKDYKLGTKQIKEELATPELLATTKVDTLTGWTVTGTLTPSTPYDSIFPNGITKMVELTTANYLSQAFTFTADPLRARRMEIKLWVRYLPPVFSSSDVYPTNSWATEDTYDLGEVNIQLQKDADNIMVKNHYVGLHWHEIKLDVDIPINETSLTLQIKSNDAKTVQFCFASVKIEN